MFSPLKYFGAGKGGKRVGIVGIGGLGQMGIRLAVALGNEVTAISTNPTKEDKCKELGAKHFVLSTDAESMKAGANSLDLILNTISATHSCVDYIPLLSRNSTIVQLGLVMEKHSFLQGICSVLHYLLSVHVLIFMLQLGKQLPFTNRHWIPPFHIFSLNYNSRVIKKCRRRFFPGSSSRVCSYPS